MKTPVKLAALTALIVGLGATGLAWAGTPVDDVRPLDAEGRVRIENLKGRIQVRTWDRAEVRVTGTLGEGVERLAIEGDAGNLSIRVVYPDARGGWFNWWGDGGRAGPSSIEVTLPQRAEVGVESVSAGIDIRGVAGRRLKAETVSGDIQAEGAPAEAEFEAVSGSLRLNLDRSQLSAETVSGNIRVEGRPGGRISLETVSGDIDLSAGTVQRLDASSVSGGLSLAPEALAGGGRIEAETLSGKLELTLPASTSARLSVSTFSGDIRSDAGEVKRPRHGPGASLEATLGAGAGDIRLESFSGSVRFRLD